MLSINHIFFSYRSNEAEFALKLATDLKNIGVRVWIDRLDIRPGQNWLRALELGINNCAALLTILSPGYTQSPYCQRELARAARLSIPIIPVLLESLEQAEWPLVTELYQYIDFTNWRSAGEYEKQLQELIKVLRSQFANQIIEAPSQEEKYLNRLIASLEVSKRVVVTDDEARHMGPMTAINMLLDSDVKVYLQNGDSKSSKTQTTETISLRELIKPDSTYPRYTLVGEPGAGKTAVLEYLVLTAAYARKKSTTSGLPFLVKGVDWKNDVSFEEFLEAKWEFESDLIPLLQQKKVTLFLDGLDEIVDNRDVKIESLRSWLYQEKTAQIVVITCRHSESHLAQSLALPIFYITNLDSTRVKDFIQFFLPEHHAQHLLRQIKGMRAFAKIDDLLADSLLLSLIIEMYSDAPNKHLPSNTSILLEKLIEKLWVRERDRRVLQFVSYEELDYTLAELAYNIFLVKGEVSLDYEQALQVVDNQLILQFAQRMHLLKKEPSQAVVRFTNKLLCDYFMARWLILQGEEQTWLAETKNIEVNPLVALLLCGMASHRIELIQQIAQVDLVLALQCIHADTSLGEEIFTNLLQQFVHEQINAKVDAKTMVEKLMALRNNYDRELKTSLYTLMRQNEWDVRQTATQLLIELEPFPLTGLQSTLIDLQSDLQEAASIALAQLGETALPTLILLAQHEDGQVRRNAIWAFNELADHAGIPTLVSLLQDDENEVVIDAIEALGYLYDVTSIPFLIDILGHRTNDVREALTDTLVWIGQLALPDLVYAVNHRRVNTRRHAVEVLKHFPEEMATQALLVASYDKNINVKIEALDTLEEREDPAVFKRFVEALLDRTKIKRTNETVAERAARALEQKGTPEAERVLDYWRKKRAELDAENETIVPEETIDSSADTAKDRLTKLTTGSERIIPAHIQEGLNSKDVTARQQAIQSLVNFDEAIVVPVLRKSLQDSYPQIRQTAIKALARYTSPDALKGLVWALSDDSHPVVDIAMQALQKNGQPVLPDLMTAIDSPKTYTRQVIIKILGEIGEPIAIPALKSQLQDESVSLIGGEKAICDWAYEALKAIGTPEAEKIATSWFEKKETKKPAPELPSDLPADQLPELIESIRTSGWGKREEATKLLYKYAKALQGTEFPDVRKQLIEMLNDEESMVRCVGLEALAWLKDSKAIEHMLKSLNDDSWTVRIAAIRSLVEFEDPAVSPAILELVLDKQTLVKEAALEAIGILGDTSIIRPLVRALDSNDSFLRLAAVQALSQIQHPDVVMPLAESCRDDDKNVRWAAVDALRSHKDERAVRHLILCLTDQDSPHWEDESIPQIAAEALENIGSKFALSAAQKWRQSQSANTQ